MKADISKVLISGATGWLGVESVVRVLQEKFEDISAPDLKLCSSDGRDLVIDGFSRLPTMPFQSRSESPNESDLKGFIHLAFLLLVRSSLQLLCH